MAKPDDETPQRLPPSFRPARPLGDLMGPIVTPAMRKRGFATADLIALWPEIVGEAFAEVSQPERLTWPRRMEAGEDAFEPAVLTIRVSGARVLLFQHESARIIERINQTFGYQAVARLKIEQKPLAPRQKRGAKPMRPLTRAEETEIGAVTEAVPDPDLRAALIRLGRAIKATRSPG
jgi:hypothetical protein